MNFGLFALGAQKLGDTEAVCDRVAQSCKAWPVHCLTTDLHWLPGSMGLRAKALADAWGGSIAETGLCSSRRLSAMVGTRLSGSFSGGSDRLDAIEAALGSEDFRLQLVHATAQVLGRDSTAVKGGLHMVHSTAALVEPKGFWDRPIETWDWGAWGAIAGAVVLLLVASLAFYTLCSGKGAKGFQQTVDADDSAQAV